jgi:hypothetical protein
MAREINRLSARKVQALSEPGRHADGGGLYLVIDPGGSKRWVLLYRMPVRRREMGFSSTSAISLARTRELAAAARAQIAERGVIRHGENKPVIACYALWEDVVQQITPVMRRHGFAITFRIFGIESVPDLPAARFDEARRLIDQRVRNQQGGR